MKEDYEREIQERLNSMTNSYGQLELDRIEATKMLLRNAEHHVIDYGYEGKRYYNPLNKDYQLNQFKRRVVRDLIQSDFEKKKEPKMWWMSRVPLSYYLKYGNWGDSKFTMQWHNREEGMAISIKPKWA